MLTSIDMHNIRFVTVPYYLRAALLHPTSATYQQAKNKFSTLSRSFLPHRQRNTARTFFRRTPSAEEYPSAKSPDLFSDISPFALAVLLYTYHFHLFLHRHFRKYGKFLTNILPRRKTSAPVTTEKFPAEEAMAKTGMS